MTILISSLADDLIFLLGSIEGTERYGLRCSKIGSGASKSSASTLLLAFFPSCSFCIWSLSKPRHVESAVGLIVWEPINMSIVILSTCLLLYTFKALPHQLFGMILESLLGRLEGILIFISYMGKLRLKGHKTGGQQRWVSLETSWLMGMCPAWHMCSPFGFSVGWA